MAFNDMIKEFGVVTVMNAKIYEYDDTICEPSTGVPTAKDVRDGYALHSTSSSTGKLLAEIDSLKVANITVEGPNKTVTGGRYSNPLIKFGKTARLEMQDALGRANAIAAFGGCVNEEVSSNITAMHITEDFSPVRTVIGETFFIDRTTGAQEWVDIVFYQVLPDSIFNLTQDAEGDATVFDMNADLLTTEISVNGTKKGVFYSILSHASASTN